MHRYPLYTIYKKIQNWILPTKLDIMLYPFKLWSVTNHWVRTPDLHSDKSYWSRHKIMLLTYSFSTSANIKARFIKYGIRLYGHDGWNVWRDECPCSGFASANLLNISNVHLANNVPAKFNSAQYYRLPE